MNVPRIFETFNNSFSFSFWQCVAAKEGATERLSGSVLSSVSLLPLQTPPALPVCACTYVHVYACRWGWGTAPISHCVRATSSPFNIHYTCIHTWFTPDDANTRERTGGNVIKRFQITQSNTMSTEVKIGMIWLQDSESASHCKCAASSVWDSLSTDN